MKVRLGYVAIALGLGSQYTTSKTMTFSYYKKQDPLQALEKLKLLAKTNLQNLMKVLHYNVKHHIEVYRITSKLIPLATHPEVQWDYKEYLYEDLQQIGQYIKEHHLRISTHPDQFVILNSPKVDVVESSIRELTHHYELFQLMGIEKQAVMVLHIGGAYGDKKQAIQWFYEGISKLPKQILSILAFENDDKLFTVTDTLEAVTQIGCPMVLDIHHHLCNNQQENLENFWPYIYKTWEMRKMVPKVHLSSPKELILSTGKIDRRHADFIDKEQFIHFLNQVKYYNRNFDVMIEAKQKDWALFRLAKEISDERDITLINEGTFLI